MSFAVVAFSSIGAEEEALIDLSIEPPLVRSPDFREVAPAPVSNRPLARAFGPIAPATRQPSGSLSGRIVFTNGGHGWTFDPNSWRLLRGNLQGMNEDYGNVDQMNFFATHCFNAGAVVVPLRPLGHQNHEVVLDNDSPAVTFAGGWADSTSAIFYGSAGDVPYRYASFSGNETATATYTPSIPATGMYPVYTWVRHGSDRGDQLYRVLHTGGEAQLRIPHHLVGNGWVYLGEYHFAAGSHPAAGSVVISNRRETATGSVIIADAIRFGNGMGSIDRGGGVSGYPREDESCRYWAQAGLGRGQPSSLYDGGGNDESDSWSTPPKMSAEMSREEAGTPFTRIYIGFHSNGGGGRGTLGLITNTPTTNQTTLAQVCGREVTDDLVALGSPPLEFAWADRSAVTLSGGYSEIDGSLFNYEMDATIIEVGFHDHAEDARLLRDSKARSAVGKAAMHAVIKFMAQRAGGPAIIPPETPGNVRARGAADGSITLSWDPPVSTGGSGMPDGYVIYRSSDGYGFGNAITAGAVNFVTIAGATLGVDHYFRIAAVNAGGESLPSQVAGCRTVLTSDAPRVLFVNAFDRFDRTTNLRQNTVRQAYVPPGGSGAIDRVWPSRVNSFDYVVPHGKALAAAGMAFDSCQNEAVSSGLIDLAEYPIVIWACGQESTANESFSTVEQARIREFRARGGHLFVSGSEIGWDLDRAIGPAMSDRDFMHDELKAAYATDDSLSYNLTPAAGGIFSARSGANFDDGSRGIYWVVTPDVLTPTGTGTRTALNYVGASAGAAAVQYDGSAGGGKVVYFGLPFETITDATRRAEYMKDILDFFTGSEVIVSRGSTWKYRQDSVDLGTAWAARDYDDSAWPAGPAQLGFGDGDEATPLLEDPSRITTYFRKQFQVADPRAYRSLTLRLLRDDGAVVYLNGVEILRSNMPTVGDVRWDTSAETGVVNADETTFFFSPIDARNLCSGENVLAVEVHQFGTTSSDLSFDLELAGTREFGSTLIGSGSVWRFLDTGVPPGPAWTFPGFDDAAWGRGPALLGYGGDEVTVVGFGGDPQNRHVTTWFRRGFTVTDLAQFDALNLELRRDDGAVVYLNGTELARDNLPAGAVAPERLATAAISGINELPWQRFVVPATALRVGENIIAAEIHQAAPDSSTLGFDLRLTGLSQSEINFADWQAARFGSDRSNPAIAGDNADPDADAHSNLLEYGTGGDPGSGSDEPLALAVIDSGALAIQFYRNALATDLTITVQGADTLEGPWIDLARSANGERFDSLVTGVTIVEDALGARRAVEVRAAHPPADPENPQRFLRLQLSW